METLQVSKRELILLEDALQLAISELQSRRDCWADNIELREVESLLERCRSIVQSQLSADGTGWGDNGGI